MPTPRAAPLLVLALAALAGAAAGLRFGPTGGADPSGGAGGEAPGAAAMLVAAALLLLLAGTAAVVLLGRSRWQEVGGRARPLPAGLVLLLAAFAGAGLGADAGRRAREACETRLRSGDEVEATGRLRSALVPQAPAGAPPATRVTLRRPELVRDGGTCRVPSLVAYLAAAPAHRPSAGDVVRLRGEWRRFGDPGPWPPRRGSGILVAARPLPPPGGAEPRAQLLESARARAARRLESRLPPDVAGLALGLTVADRDGIPADLTRRFADAGLAHLLAISGLHVGILAAGATWALGLALSRRSRYLAAAAACAAYVAAIGAPPAAVRALLLFVGLAGARVRGSPARAGDLLGAAALLVLLLDPAAILGPGFQLSFAGFAGLAAGGSLGERAVAAVLSRAPQPGRASAARRGLRRGAVAVAASAGAFAFTAPIAAAHFGRATPAAIVSNFLGVPLVAASLAGLAGVLALPAAPASLLGDGVAVLLRLLVRVVDRVAALPGASSAAGAPGLAGWGVAALLLLALLRLLVARRPATSLLPLGAAGGLWLAGPILPVLLPHRAALLCSLDVGQGDAAALRTRRGAWVVFDAGPPPRGRGDGVASFLARRGARRVDLLVLSHPHLDHLGGAEELLGRFNVRGVLDAGNPVPEPRYDRFLAAIGEEGAGWLPARAGARLTVDGAQIAVIGPLRPPPGDGEEAAADANEASVAVRVEADGLVYLNTGDASAAEEAEMLARWPVAWLRADVLKLGHHGSRTSSSLAWLRATRPEIAVVSAGRGNRYGHPHRVTLARLDSAGVPRVWRTDRDGSLCVEAGGGGWRVVGE